MLIFWMRDLQQQLVKNYKPGLDSMHCKLVIPQQVLTILMWWASTPNVMKSISFIFPPMSVIFTASASTLGWGAHLKNNRLVRPHWSPEEKNLHIYSWELRAVRLALKSFLAQVKHRVVQVLTDTVMALSYLNKQREAHSLQLCKVLWEWCIE